MSGSVSSMYLAFRLKSITLAWNRVSVNRFLTTFTSRWASQFDTDYFLCNFASLFDRVDSFLTDRRLGLFTAYAVVSQSPSIIRYFRFFQTFSTWCTSELIASFAVVRNGGVVGCADSGPCAHVSRNYSTTIITLARTHSNDCHSCVHKSDVIVFFLFLTQLQAIHSLIHFYLTEMIVANWFFLFLFTLSFFILLYQ